VTIRQRMVELMSSLDRRVKNLATVFVEVLTNSSNHKCQSIRRVWSWEFILKIGIFIYYFLGLFAQMKRWLNWWHYATDFSTAQEDKEVINVSTRPYTRTKTILLDLTVLLGND